MLKNTVSLKNSRKRAQNNKKSKIANGKYIVFGAPSITEREISAVVETLKSGWIGTGPRVKKFEDKIISYVGARNGAALNSCTAGIHLSLLSFGIGLGDEVITTPLTFCATANAIIHTGARPVFVDINPATLNIDENKIKSAITKNTKAIIPVHLMGRPCEMDEIIKIAKKHQLIVIEDAAHALGAEYKGKKIGAIGDTTCFSFYVTKNITTGEGGMVVSKNDKIMKKLRMQSLHGMSHDAWKRYTQDGFKHYSIVSPGFKYNMTDVQAALGISQFERIDEFDAFRKKVWNLYIDSFRDLPIELPPTIPSHMKHARHLFTILVDKKKSGINRDDFIREMHRRNIGTSVHFRPIHLQPFYKKEFGYKRGDYPNAEYVGERIVSLPLGTRLKIEEVRRVIKATREIFGKK